MKFPDKDLAMYAESGLRTEQRLSHDGMNAVCTDNQWRLNTTVVSKLERGVGFVLLNRDQLFAEMDAVARHQGSES